ncbi:hypothetical protein [Marinobacterium stanieri]|uniref:HEPN AbiU2-like domain-containing protein n=1 Tax=Marinobacterium stanieri TaxID=49186 RepID=A0A1N6Q1Y2_9GAMM|nr:hypothetical protein [Marinobacterium stanieri]SIQ10535.1 hypothetical protein SAMN05421647_102195 [Marinobacterium stanieri]
MFTVDSNFIGEFKTGDNINYNLKVLSVLYQSQCDAPSEDAPLFCKPIIISLTSVVEALLHDLFYRINNFTSEGVENIADEVLEAVREKTLDQFATYIDGAKKHKLLGEDDDLYDELHALRQVRNRIHIQNAKQILDRDEVRVFTPACQESAELALEQVIKHVSSSYMRSDFTQGYVDDFQLPWEERLTDEM